MANKRALLDDVEDVDCSTNGAKRCKVQNDTKETCDLSSYGLQLLTSLLACNEWLPSDIIRYVVFPYAYISVAEHAETIARLMREQMLRDRHCNPAPQRMWGTIYNHADYSSAAYIRRACQLSESESIHPLHAYSVKRNKDNRYTWLDFVQCKKSDTGRHEEWTSWQRLSVITSYYCVLFLVAIDQDSGDLFVWHNRSLPSAWVQIGNVHTSKHHGLCFININIGCVFINGHLVPSSAFETLCPECKNTGIFA